MSIRLRPSNHFQLGVKRSNRAQAKRGFGEAEVICHLHLPARKALFLGVSDGQLVFWKRRGDFKAEVHRCVLKEHRGAIFSLLFLEHLRPSGLLLTCSADRSIKVWDVWRRDLREACVQTLVGHQGSVTDISHNRGLLISCSNDGTMRVWRRDASRAPMLYPWFECVRVFSVAGGTLRAPVVTCASLTRAEALVTFVGDEKGRMLSLTPMHEDDTSSEAVVTQLRPPQRVHRRAVTKMIVIAHESFLISLSFDNTVQVIDALTGHAFFAIENPNRCRYMSAAWDRRHQELFLGDERGFLQVWNIYMEQCLSNVQLQPVRALVSMSCDGDQLSIAGRDGVCVFELVRDSKFQAFKGHKGAVVCLVSVLPSGGGAGSAAARVLQEHKSGSGDSSAQEEAEATATVAAREREHTLFSVGLDNTIRCWDPYDMSCLSVIREADNEINCMLHLPQTSFLMTGHVDGTLKVWNCHSGSSLKLERHTNSVTALLFCRTRRLDYVISVSFDSTATVWDVNRRRSERESAAALAPWPEVQFTCSDAELLCAAFVDRDATFVTAGNEAVIRRWDLEGKRLGEFVGHQEAVTALAIDGNFLISGADDGNLSIWDLYSCKQLRSLSAHLRSVQSLIVVPFTGYIVSCAFDGRIRVWDYTEQPRLEGDLHTPKFEFVQPNKHFSCLLYNKARRHARSQAASSSSSNPGFAQQLYVGTEGAAIIILELPDKLFEQHHGEGDGGKQLQCDEEGVPEVNYAQV